MLEPQRGVKIPKSQGARMSAAPVANKNVISRIRHGRSMGSPVGLWWLALVLAGTLRILPAQQFAPTGISLLTSASQVNYGTSITLTARVTPAGVTGNVMFLDGTSVIGIGPVNAGQATLTATLLASGTRTLRARYGGDGFYASSTSPPVNAGVVSGAQNGFQVGSAIYQTSTIPNGIAIGDFNADGKLDVATANTGDNVNVMMGSGDGTFRISAAISLPGLPEGVATGDLNSDGKLDLIVVSLSSSRLNVLLGNGDGTFKPSVTFATGSSPYSVAVADFNGDGKSDVVVARYGGIDLFLGNGDGGVRGPSSYAVGNPLGPATWVSVGDFNADGRPDLVVANPSELSTTQGRFGNNISILLGLGDGTFQVPVNYSAGTNPGVVNIGDFNGDGISDLATANGNGNSIGILLGKGDGTFQDAASYVIGTAARSIAIGDFNGDGRQDLAAHGRTTGLVLLIGNGDGTFQVTSTAPTDGAVASSPAILTGEFNGDGRSDLVYAFSGAGSPSSGVLTLLGSRAIPTFTTIGIVNSASYVGDGNVAPGEIVSIFGSGLGPAPLAGLQLNSSGYLGTSLGGVQVLFDGTPAPLVFTSFGQLSTIVPYSVAGKTTTQVRVSYQGEASPPVTLGVFRSRPGVFTSNASGRGQGAILNQNGTLNSSSNPATIGSFISLYITGDGQTTPGGIDGKLGSIPPAYTLQTVSVFVGGSGNGLTYPLGGKSATVQYSGGVYGLVAGVSQINVQIPQGISPGNTVPLVVAVGDSYSQVVTVAIK